MHTDQQGSTWRSRLAATKQARRATIVPCKIALLLRPFTSFVVADWRHRKKGSI